MMALTLLKFTTDIKWEVKISVIINTPVATSKVSSLGEDGCYLMTLGLRAGRAITFRGASWKCLTDYGSQWCIVFLLHKPSLQNGLYTQRQTHNLTVFSNLKNQKEIENTDHWE